MPIEKVSIEKVSEGLLFNPSDTFSSPLFLPFDKDPPTGLGEAIGARPETNATYDPLGRYYTAGVRLNF